jgi:hypothetical protein
MTWSEHWPEVAVTVIAVEPAVPQTKVVLLEDEFKKVPELAVQL